MTDIIIVPIILIIFIIVCVVMMIADIKSVNKVIRDTDESTKRYIYTVWVSRQLVKLSFILQKATQN